MLRAPSKVNCLVRGICATDEHVSDEWRRSLAFFRNASDAAIFTDTATSTTWLEPDYLHLSLHALRSHGEVEVASTHTSS
jgi:hypothetical protein